MGQHPPPVSPLEPPLTRTASRLLAAAGLVALTGGVGLTGYAASSTAAPAPAPANAEPDLRELLAGKDGSVVPRIEGNADRLLVDSQLSAIHAAPPWQGVAARHAGAQQAQALPQSQAAGLTGTWTPAHDEFRADDPQYGMAELGWKEIGGRTI